MINTSTYSAEQGQPTWKHLRTGFTRLTLFLLLVTGIVAVTDWAFIEGRAAYSPAQSTESAAASQQLPFDIEAHEAHLNALMTACKKSPSLKWSVQGFSMDCAKFLAPADVPHVTLPASGTADELSHYDRVKQFEFAYNLISEINNNKRTGTSSTQRSIDEQGIYLSNSPPINKYKYNNISSYNSENLSIGTSQASEYMNISYEDVLITKEYVNYVLRSNNLKELN